MKKINKFIFLFLSLLALSSCSNDYFDVNTPSNEVNENALELKLLFPTIEKQTTNMFFSEAYPASLIQQHTASYFAGGLDQHYETSMYSVWQTYYTKVLFTIKKAEQIANEQNAKHYLGVIQVMKALSLGIATDIYGDMPYTEASLGGDNLDPAVDSQQSLYQEIQNLLDAGIANITASDNSGLENIENDIFYGGDLGKWERLAYTLKARYALHLIKQNGATASAQEALNYLQNGFTSNDDDLQLFYNEKNKNPWHTSVVLAANTGNISVLFSERLINYMNGTVLGTVDIDPRLPIYADNGGAATYEGGQNGNEGNTSAGTAANAVFNGNGYYFKQDSPLVLVSYMEAQFLKAEAEFLLNNGPNQNAYDAYLEGITASMDKIGVDPTLRDAYLADPAIAVSAANLTLKDIMVQKYIALLLNPEIFTDLRRYDFSTTIYPTFDFPVNRNPDMPAGEWPRRAIYPSGEVDMNSHITQVNFWDRVWWDQ